MFLLKSMSRILSVLVILSTLTACTSTVIEETTAVPTEIATEAAPLETSVSQTTEMGLVQFEPGYTSWYMPGTLAPNTTSVFNVQALKGQQLTIWLTTSPSSEETMLAGLNIKDQAGQNMTTAPATYWSQVLPADQVYTIEVQSYTQEEITYSLVIELPEQTIDPAFGNMYQPLDGAMCRALKAQGVTALGTDLGLEELAPFMDELGGEAGQGCRIATAGYGTQFSSPQDVVTSLVESMGMGWTELIDYQADGPTGSSTGLVRDMALMLISASWEPDQGVECPSDKPISDCDLTDDQKFYTIEVTVAQYMADFSMDGHWVDETTGFTLDLYQEWKNIWGQHEVVAQDGNKIDSLEASIDGSLNGKVATVEFKSSFTDETGIAEITYVDVNTIQWKIITAPGGEYYLPAEATLLRTAQ
jgi:hypothetical protein